MKTSLRYWAGWFLFLLLLDLVVPFVWLKGVPGFAGFLFWLIWIGTAIGSMFIMFRPWREAGAVSDRQNRAASNDGRGSDTE